MAGDEDVRPLRRDGMRRFPKSSFTLVSAGLVVLVLVAAWSAHRSGLADGIQDLGRAGTWAGVLCVVLLYALAAQLFVPVTPLIVVAALALGPLWGFVAVQSGSVAAAAIGFVLARHLGRSGFERLVASRGPSCRSAVERLRRAGFEAVVLARLVPVLPPGLANYAFGLSRVSFGGYLLGSILGTIPVNGSIVLGADAVHRAFVPGEKAWLAGLLPGALVLSVLLVLRRRVKDCRRDGRSGTVPGRATDDLVPGIPDRPDSPGRPSLASWE